MLEVGSAWGRIIEMCVEREVPVVGIDINTRDLNKLRHKLSNELESGQVRLFQESVLDMHFSDNEFGGVFLQGLLSTLKAEMRINALSEVQRVLRPKGVVHIAEFLRDESNAEQTARYEKDVNITGEYGAIAVKDTEGKVLFTSKHFTKEELTILLEQAGLSILQLKEMTFKTYKGKLRPGITIIAKKEESL